MLSVRAVRPHQRERVSSGLRCWCCTLDHLHMTSNATCSDILDVRCCGRGQRPSLSFSLALLEQHCGQCKHKSVYEQRETLWWISPVKISCKTCALSNNQPCWYWKNKQLVQSVLSFMLFFYLRSLSLIFVQGTNGGKWAAALISVHQMFYLHNALQDANGAESIW